MRLLPWPSDDPAQPNKYFIWFFGCQIGQWGQLLATRVCYGSFVHYCWHAGCDPAAAH
jgi:hypothetical protein